MLDLIHFFEITFCYIFKCSTTCGMGHRVGQLSCELVGISQGIRPTTALLSEAECLYQLGSNISLHIDGRREDPTVYIVRSGSQEDREVLQRAPYIRPLPFTPGKPLLLACSNPPCHSQSFEWVQEEWSAVCDFHSDMHLKSLKVFCYHFTGSRWYSYHLEMILSISLYSLVLKCQ